MSKRTPLLLFAAASLAFVSLGVLLLFNVRVNPQHYGEAPMAEYYLSMACRCDWFGGKLPWTIHGIAAPYRYRVLVPWLAGLLPMNGIAALAAITYASLAACYFIVLVTCRRLGCGAAASVAALALPFAFESHLVNYFHPFLVEGFGLLILAVMTYALVLDAFWLFAIAGLCGVFAREITWFVLPVWCARDVKRGVTLTIAAASVLLVERSVLWGPPVSYPIDPASIAAWHLREFGNFIRDIRAVVSWEPGVIALGVLLLPAAAFAVVAPMFAGLAAAAVIASYLATDTARLFGVLMPIAVIATAQLLSVLAKRRHYVMIAMLAVLLLIQYAVTPNNGLPFDPGVMAARLRPIRLGTLWTVAAAFLLRRDWLWRRREGLMPRSSRPWSLAAAMPGWPVFILWLLMPAAALAGISRFGDPEQRDLDRAARASAPGAFVTLSAGETHFEFAGPAAGPVVVLASGISEPYYVWDPTADALVRAGFRVLRYDYYGRGYSDRPDVAYTQDLLVRQLAELLDSQHITQPVHLGGVAFGASIVTSFADRYPDRVRSLTFVGPAFRRGPLGTRESDPQRLGQKGFEAMPMPPTVQNTGPTPVLWSFATAAFEERWWAESQWSDFARPEQFPDWPDRYRAQMQYRGFRRAQWSTMVSNAALDQTEELRHVGAHSRPVIVFWGTQDRVVPFSLSGELARVMPRATIVAVDGAGHLPQWERPSAVHPALVDFLR